MMKINVNSLYCLISTVDISNKHYVYSLVNPLTNLPFYIGKGVRYRYSYHLREYLQYSHTTSAKLFFIHHIISSNLKVIVKILSVFDTEEEALNEEKRLILIHGRLFEYQGYLTNYTIGGHSLSGRHNPMFGKKRTYKEKEKISRTRLERFKSGKIIPTKHSLEWRQQLMKNNAGGKATSIPIYQIDATTGLIIKKWFSARQAACELGVSNGNISNAVKNKNITSAGFLWRKVSESILVDGYISDFKEILKERQKTSAGKPILQIDKNSLKVIREWDSAQIAYRELGIHFSSISSVCNKEKGTAGGFIWKFKLVSPPGLEPGTDKL